MEWRSLSAALIVLSRSARAWSTLSRWTLMCPSSSRPVACWRASRGRSLSTVRSWGTDASCLSFGRERTFRSEDVILGSRPGPRRVTSCDLRCRRLVGMESEVGRQFRIDLLQGVERLGHAELPVDREEPALELFVGHLFLLCLDSQGA